MNTERYKFITQLDDKQVNELHQLYQHEWWSSNRTLSETSQLLKNSSYHFGFVDNSGSLVAFCRVLTDKCYFAYIYDVIVKSNFRGVGIGSALIKNVVSYEHIRNLESIELVCRQNTIEFYESLGFSQDYGKSKPMRLILKKNMF